MDNAIVKRAVKQAIENLCSGFLWAETPPGSKYWGEVIDNLKKLLLSDVKEIDGQMYKRYTDSDGKEYWVYDVKQE